MARTDSPLLLARAPAFGSIPLSEPLGPVAERQEEEETRTHRPGEGERLLAQTTADIEAAQAQIRERPAIVSSELETRTSQLPTLTRAEERAQTTESEKRLKAVTGKLEKGEERLGELQVQAGAAAQDAVTELRGLRDQLGDRAPGLRAAFEREEQNFARLRQELESAEIDPARLVTSMPTWAQSILAIANAFQRRDPRTGQMPVADIINKAIARDLGVQKANLARQLDMLGVASREKQFALNRLDNNLARRADLALKISRARTGGLIAETNVLSQKIRLVEESANIGRTEQGLQLRVKEAARPKTTVTKQIQRQAADREAEAKEVARLKFEDKDEGKFLDHIGDSTDDLLTLAKDLRDLKDSSRGGGLGAALAGKIPFVKNRAKVAQGFAKRIALNLAKQVSGATITDAEREAFEAAIPGLLDTNAASRNQARILMGQGIRGLIRRSNRLRKQGNLAGAQEYARVAAKMERTAREIDNLFKGD